MGACCSGDSLPPVPKEIQQDPPTNAPMQVTVQKMGWFGRDWAIYNGTEAPSGSKDKQEKMWLWFNKSDGAIPNTGTIDLENFVRGSNPKNKDKGKILYTASITERPLFEQFQRTASSGMQSFFGFTTSPTAYEDQYYLNHQRHSSKRRYDVQILEPQMITKWRLTTKATIRDGDTGRAAASFGGQEVTLFVHSSGTVATTWERHMRMVEITDDQGNVVGTRQEEDIIKVETEFVDTVDFQMIIANQLWATWSVPGDSQPGQQDDGDVTISTPFFDCVRKGGWFSTSSLVLTAKPPADPAFCIMLAFLCGTEYSLAEIKRDLNANTPSRPPGMGFMWGPQQGTSLGYTPVQPQGQFAMNYY